jgi:hypothetical protein
MVLSVASRVDRLLSRTGLVGLLLCSACGGASAPAAPSVFTVHAQGVLAIPQTNLVDLDRGVLAPPMSDVDLWFEAVTWTERYLSAVNGATMAVVGTSPPGRAGCASAALHAGRVSIDTLTVGVYACVRTNQGRYAQVRIEQMPGPQPAAGEPAPSLSIAFTTYE